MNAVIMHSKCGLHRKCYMCFVFSGYIDVYNQKTWTNAMCISCLQHLGASTCACASIAMQVHDKRAHWFKGPIVTIHLAHDAIQEIIFFDKMQYSTFINILQYCVFSNDPLSNIVTHVWKLYFEQFSQ